MMYMRKPTTWTFKKRITCLKYFLDIFEVQKESDLEHLNLKDFHHDCLLTFVPNKHEDLSSGQRRFLMKSILRNFVFEAPDPRFEPYVQEWNLDDSSIPLKIIVGH